MKISNNILNADNLKAVISKSTIEIKQNSKGVIELCIDFNYNLDTGGYLGYLPMHHTVVRYTGALGYYDGLDYKDCELSAQMTEGARKIWSTFKDDMGKLMLDYIKNN